jgi:hypothetical protein
VQELNVARKMAEKVVHKRKCAEGLREKETRDGDTKEEKMEQDDNVEENKSPGGGGTIDFGPDDKDSWKMKRLRTGGKKKPSKGNKRVKRS